MKCVSLFCLVGTVGVRFSGLLFDHVSVEKKGRLYRKELLSVRSHSGLAIVKAHRSIVSILAV